MKYKIIGWTDYYDQDYPEHEKVTDYIRRLIIEEIRKHGYLFGGDRHEDYCPVLNDGTMVCYSWRGWGGVMADAWNVDNSSGMSYMFAYMDELLNPKARKYPRDYVNDRLIVDKSTLVENFEVEVDEKLFSAVAGGKRKVKLHIADDVRERMDRGDFITLVNKTSGEKLKFEVSDVVYFEPSYKMYLESREFAEFKRQQSKASTQSESGGVQGEGVGTTGESGDVQGEGAKGEGCCTQGEGGGTTGTVTRDLNGNPIESSEYDELNRNYFRYYQKQQKEHYGDIELRLKDV